VATATYGQHHNSDLYRRAYSTASFAEGMQPHFCRPPAPASLQAEVLTDGVAELAQCGVVNCSSKTFMHGKVVATLALGSRRLYDWMVRAGWRLFCGLGRWSNLSALEKTGMPRCE